MGRGPALLVGSLLLVVLVLVLAPHGDDQGGAPPERPAPRERARPGLASEVAPIARRVERLRDLRFKTIPRPVVVTPEQVRRDGLRDLERSTTPARTRAEETALRELGLLDAEDTLKRVAGEIYAEQVAGFYDPRTGRLALVRGADAGALGEVTLAHELTHALEDQRFGLDDVADRMLDDRSLAGLAMVEGTATALMIDYGEKQLSPGELLGGALAGDTGLGADLPPYLAARLSWPYLQGSRWVGALRDRGRGSWRLVDIAERVRPPASTEQVLHPRKWLEVEQPLPVRPRLAEALGEGWKRTLATQLGEWDTLQLLRLGGDSTRAGTAAEGWGGGRLELWQKGAERALVLAWAGDTARDGAQLAAALPDSVKATLRGVPAGAGTWRLPGGRWAALRHRGAGVGLATASTRSQAAVLASQAAGAGSSAGRAGDS
jgi:hypothetical protein